MLPHTLHVSSFDKPLSARCHVRRRFPTLWVLTAIAWLMFCAASPGYAESTRYFAIRIRSKLVGYAKVVHRTAESGDPVCESWTALKVSLLGTPRRIHIHSVTTLDKETRSPVHVLLTRSINGRETRWEVTIEGKRAVVRQETADDTKAASSTELDIPQSVLVLAGNDFGQWDLVLARAHAKARDGRAVLPVILPEAGRLSEIKLQKVEAQEVEHHDRRQPAVVWKMLDSDMQLHADAESHELIRMDLPAQETVIERADESVVKRWEKAQAEEVLADRFARSNVVFDDFLAVRMLRARIQVRVFGDNESPEKEAKKPNENDANEERQVAEKTTSASPSDSLQTLRTSMQSFEGTRRGSRIEGIVTVRSIRFDPSTAPAVGETVSSTFQPWLQPSVYVESDDPEVAALARELTQDCKTRWDQVLAVGRWVHDQIHYTIADTPSAKLALKTKRGDCGPHATLTIALLRSLGIPAKLVGGLLYTPSFGGSFGQHAWVEVHMGSAGWVPIDPTTGEFETVSAVHMKLFEGLGGVVADKVEVLEFAPPNRPSDVVRPRKRRPFPWKLGTTYRLRYRQGNVELGTETFTWRNIETDGKEQLELRGELDLKTPLGIAVASSQRLVAQADATPVQLQRTWRAPREATVDCRFEPGKVSVRIEGSRQLERTIELPENAYTFDNNWIGSFALIFSQLPLKKGNVRIETFHPSTLQRIPLTITFEERESVKVSGQELECWRCQVAPIRNTFWVTTDGRLVKVVAGNLSIELDAAP